jgi:acyl carrier protein
MDKTILGQVREVAADIFGVAVETVTQESSPSTIENWDSLQHLNLVLALEDRFGVGFVPEEIEAMRDIAAIVHVVEGKGTRVGAGRS